MHRTLKITIHGERGSGKTVLAAKLGQLLFDMGADVEHIGYSGQLLPQNTRVNYRNHTIIIDDDGNNDIGEE